MVGSSRRALTGIYRQSCVFAWYTAGAKGSNEVAAVGRLTLIGRTATINGRCIDVYYLNRACKAPFFASLAESVGDSMGFSYEFR